MTEFLVLTEFFLIPDPGYGGLPVLCSRPAPDRPASPVKSPCCAGRVAEPMIVTALCLSCFEAFELDLIPEVAAAMA